MKTSATAVFLLAGMLLAALPGATAQAQSLEQLHYRLHQDAQAQVEEPLRRLADRGDNASRLLLADLLAKGANARQRQEAIELYQAAFDRGQGELNALGRLAALVDRHQLHLAQQRAFFQDALQRFPPTRDLVTIVNALDVFLSYPDLLTTRQAEELIRLYQRACLENCRALTYQAILAEQLGQSEQADAYLRQAAKQDARAVDRYFQRLGDDAAPKLRALADSLAAQRAQLPLVVVQRLGSLLSNLGDEYDPRVTDWLDHAIQRGSQPALPARISYMMAYSTQHDSHETFALIDRYQSNHPQQARALRASAHLVRNWPTLDPFKAEALIRELIAEGYQNAYLTLGELYSMGGLDEADQFKAIEAYRHLTPQGHAPAFYRLANLYAHGRAICQDKVKAYAYARIAVDFGEQGAAHLLNQLAEQLDTDGLARALEQRNALLRTEVVL